MHEKPNRILEFLTTPARPDGDSCRSNRRRKSNAKVELAWLDGSQWRSSTARLRDISRGGACLVCRQSPQTSRSVRLRFVEGEGSPWIEAHILGVEADMPSRHRIRMRFEEPCPSFVLRLAVLGNVEPEDEVPPVRPDWVTWDLKPSR